MKKKRILIVDDEKSVRVMLFSVLRIGNYAIDVAENGSQAIDYIEKTIYDLVITDYMMPGMNGLELIQKIKSKSPATPVLVITGTESARDLLKMESMACLAKPFNISDLQNMVQGLLEKAPLED